MEKVYRVDDSKVHIRDIYEKILKITDIKKRLQRMCFPVNIAKCLRIAFFIEHLMAASG